MKQIGEKNAESWKLRGIEYDLQFSPSDQVYQAFRDDMQFLESENWYEPHQGLLVV